MKKIEHELEFKGVVLNVLFYYTPPEPTVMYYSDMSGHPGSPAEIEIINIQIGDQDAMELLEDYIDEITELLYEI
jgi:hypothetical protein